MGVSFDSNSSLCALQAISELMNEEAVLYKEKINFKLPGAKGQSLHDEHEVGFHHLICTKVGTSSNSVKD